MLCLTILIEFIAKGLVKALTLQGMIKYIYVQYRSLN